MAGHRGRRRDAGAGPATSRPGRGGALAGALESGESPARCHGGVAKNARMIALPMLSRYVVPEILGHLLAVTAIVVGISMLQRLSGFLVEAADGSLPADVVFSLLSLRTVVSLPSLLPAILYLAIVLGVGRLHQDGEVTALESCGISPLRLAQGVLLLAAAVAVLVAELSFAIAPWAAARFNQVKQQAVDTQGVGELAPRRFYEIGPGGRQVLFAGGRRPDGRMSDVFLQEWEDDGISIFSGDAVADHAD